ncbi:MAG: hypothetical protein V1661_00230 [bacterium]
MGEIKRQNPVLYQSKLTLLICFLVGLCALSAFVVLQELINLRGTIILDDLSAALRLVICALITAVLLGLIFHGFKLQAAAKRKSMLLDETLSAYVKEILQPETPKQNRTAKKCGGKKKNSKKK